MVSVLLSTYNETLDEVKTAVNSVLEQSYSDLEVIIVLDNPDNLVVNQWLEDIANRDKRVKCIAHKCNAGLVQSLNDAFIASCGEMIARMDADDVCMSDRIFKQVKYMEKHPECDILGTGRIDINENGDLLKSRHGVFRTNAAIWKAMPYGCPFTHPTIMMRREVLERLEGYRDIPSAEDYDLYLRAKQAGFEMANLKDVLLYYRIREDGISMSNPYKSLYGAHYALKCNRKGKLVPYECESQFEKKNKNYKRYLVALKERHLGQLLICVIRDWRLFYELYRNLRFQWMMKMVENRDVN